MAHKPPPAPPPPAKPVDSDSDLLVGFAKGQVVFGEGDAGRDMYIVESGEVEIVRRGHGGRQDRIAVLEAGDFFGEMSLLEGRPRNATARCLTDARLLPIDAATFDRMLRQYPEVTIRILRSLSSRLRAYEEAEQKAREVAAGVLAGAKRSVAEAAAAAPLAPVFDPAPSGGAPDVRLPLPTRAETAARLVHLDSGKVFLLRGEHENTVGRLDPATGRRPDVDLQTLDTKRSLSRMHARIDCRGGKLVVTEEIGTVNGTWVNGERLPNGKPREVRPGDLLRFGAVELRLEAPERAA